jgi:hypothetical protein
VIGSLLLPILGGAAPFIVLVDETLGSAGMVVGAVCVVVAVGLAVAAIVKGVARRSAVIVAASLGSLSLSSAVLVGGASWITVKNVRAKAKEKELFYDRATADSKYDTTQAIVDEAYRFRIDWPGRPWRLLREEDATQLVPGAVAAAVRSKPTISGAVIVEEASGLSLGSFSHAVVDALPSPKHHVSRKDSQRFGQRAIEAVTEIRANDVWIRFHHVLFLHGGYAYRVVAWGSTESAPIDGSAFAPFFDAFSLLPGPVTGRHSSAPVLDGHGTGWRVRSGVFEDGAYGFAIDPCVGWRLDTDTDGAEVTLQSARPSATIYFLGELAQGQTLKQREVDLAYELEESGPAAGKITLEVAGRPVAFHRFLEEDEIQREILAGIVQHGDVFLIVEAQYVASSRDEVERALAPVLGAVRLLDRTALAKLRIELLAQPDTQVALGQDEVYRHGMYRDFEHGLTWKRPGGFWRVSVGESAISLFDPTTNLTSRISTRELGEQEAFADAHRVRTQWLACKGACTPVQRVVASRPALTTTGGYKHNPDYANRLTSIDLGDKVLTVDSSGSRRALEAAASSVQAVENGFLFPGKDLVPIETGRGLHRDERFGFELDLSWASLEVRAHTPPAVAAPATVVSAERGLLSAVVMAVVPGGGASVAWMTGYLEQNTRKSVGEGEKAAPLRDEALLGGLPARRTRWNGPKVTELRIVERGGIVYGLITSFDRGQPEQGELLERSFRFLD